MAEDLKELKVFDSDLTPVIADDVQNTKLTEMLGAPDQVQAILDDENK